MSYLMIGGGRPLHGRIAVQCAKNSVLPVLAAALLAGDTCRIAECPRLSDVETAAEILRHLGCTAQWDGNDLLVDTTRISRCDIPEELMRKMRSVAFRMYFCAFIFLSICFIFCLKERLF